MIGIIIDHIAAKHFIRGLKKLRKVYLTDTETNGMCIEIEYIKNKLTKFQYEYIQDQIDDFGSRINYVGSYFWPKRDKQSRINFLNNEIDALSGYTIKAKINKLINRLRR